MRHPPNQEQAELTAWPPHRARCAAPVYGAGGELLFSGQDLGVGGVLSYVHDVFYITAFVQLAGCATDYAWLAFLLVRAGQLVGAAVVLPPVPCCSGSELLCLRCPAAAYLRHAGAMRKCCGGGWEVCTRFMLAVGPLLQIPGYALYMLATKVLIPYWVSAGQAPRPPPCWSAAASAATPVVNGVHRLRAWLLRLPLPLQNQPKLADVPESEADRKRREKKERQAARSAKFAARR